MEDTTKKAPKKAQEAAPQAPQQQPATPEQPTSPAPPVEQKTQVAKTNPIERFDAVRERCVEFFGTEARFLQEATFLLALVNNTPAIQACTPASITGVLLNIASTGLSLNPVLKLVYVIPRNVKVKTASGEVWEKRASVEPSYMGLMKLATDTGAVRNFEVHEVYKGDEFDFDIVEKRPRVHKPYWTLGRERGPIIGVYGYALLADGTVIPEHMGADELKKIQGKSDNASGSVYTDWQGEMARKSLLKRLQKYIPRTEKSERFLQAVELDNEGYDLSRQLPAAGVPEAVQEQNNLKDEVRELLKEYQGGDKAEIKRICAEQASSGKVEPEFWRGILKRIYA